MCFPIKCGVACCSFLALFVWAVWLNIYLKNIQKGILSESALLEKEAYLSDIRSSPQVENRVSIVLILADDLGFDLSSYGSPIQTKNIDRIGKDGIKFMNYYAPAGVCTPSRAALLTGRFALRTGAQNHVFFPNGHLLTYLRRLFGYPLGLNIDEITIAEVLKAAGYFTILIGKWHLGSINGHLPNDFGFDHYYGALYSNDMQPFEIWRNTELAIPEQDLKQQELSEHYTAETLRVLKEVFRTGKPFFLYYAPNAPHDPLYASKSNHGKSGIGVYGDVITDLDKSVGRIIDLLEQKKQAENTLVIFTSDNGPWFEGSVQGFRGRKSFPAFEGTFRVPLLICWPKRLQKGLVFHSPVHGTDFFPTILRAAGISKLPAKRKYDGENLLHLWERGKENRNKTLYYFVGDSLISIRKGPWKLHLHHAVILEELLLKPLKLFSRPLSPQNRYESWMWLSNLDIDVHESYDLTTNYRQVAEHLWGIASKWLEEFNQNRRGFVHDDLVLDKEL